MPSCNTYRFTWVSLTLDVGYLCTAAAAKRSCCSLPWTRDISSWLLAAPIPDLNGSRVRCCKEQYCIGTWNVRSMNQGKLEVVQMVNTEIRLILFFVAKDGRVMVESSDKMCSTGEGNSKPLQYSCLENPMNSMKGKMIGY